MSLTFPETMLELPVAILENGLNPSEPAGRIHVYTSYELMGVKVRSFSFRSILLFKLGYML